MPVRKATTTAPPLLTLGKANVAETTKAVRDKTFVPWYPAPAAATVVPTGTPAAPRPRVHSFRDETNALQEVHVSAPRGGTRCFWCFRAVDGPVAPTSLPLERVGTSYRDHGTFCGHNRMKCVYAWALRELDRPVRRRDVAFINSIALLHTVFRSVHPGAVLVPAADYSLLASNGGQVEEADWDCMTSDAFYHPRASTADGVVHMPIGKLTTNISPVASGNAAVLYPAKDPMFPALRPIVRA